MTNQIKKAEELSSSAMVIIMETNVSAAYFAASIMV
jgi:hypothetical protein